MSVYGDPKKTTIFVRSMPGDSDWPAMRKVDRYVCSTGHPHPTLAGAVACHDAREAGASNDDLLALFDAEVAAFNAAQ